VCYLLLLVYILFQDTADARAFMRHLSPSLGVELPERSYGADCRLYTPDDPDGNVVRNLTDTLLDEFVIAHLLGWWGKAILLRDERLLWALSILFELMELTFQHWLKNFNECWWDSWILDVCLCNAIGLYTGLATVRFFQGKTYNWTGLQTPLQFVTPRSVEPLRWNLVDSPTRFLQCCLLLTFALAFFLKFVLWVPPQNLLNTYRLLLGFLYCIPAVREYYIFISHDGPAWSAVNKLGVFAWLGISATLVEVLIVLKHGRGMFTEPFPTRVVVFWAVTGVVTGIWLVRWSLRLAKERRG